MFTGIIEDVGEVESVASSRQGRSLTVAHHFDPATIAIGDSVSHSGVCLTVVSMQGARFTVDVGPETLARTTMGQLAAGSKINLERSLTLQKKLGGHLVQGHVDAVGRIVRITPHANAHDFEVEAPPEVLRLTVPRGSIAIDGISLTVTGRTPSAFTVMIIPHTFQVTTLGAKRVGDPVNLEADMIARYVAALLEPFAPKSGVTEEFLKEHGF